MRDYLSYLFILSWVYPLVLPWKGYDYNETYFKTTLLCSHCGWLLLKCSAVGIGFNGAETNCGIAHISGIQLMNSYNIDLFFSNYYNLQSVHFELLGSLRNRTAGTLRTAE